MGRSTHHWRPRSRRHNEGDEARMAWPSDSIHTTGAEGLRPFTDTHRCATDFAPAHADRHRAAAHPPKLDTALLPSDNLDGCPIAR